MDVKSKIKINNSLVQKNLLVLSSNRQIIRIFKSNHRKNLLLKFLKILIKQTYRLKIPLVIYKERYNKHIHKHSIKVFRRIIN
jgi:hypothetical protein